MIDSTLINAKILIVDDQQVNIDVLTGLLDAKGYTSIQTTTDSRNVVRLFEEFKPDLILLDLAMPHVNGFQVMEQLKDLIPAGTYIPILVLTADITSESKQKSLAGGASDFLTKPFDLVEVDLRIKNLLETRYLQQRLENQNQILEEKVRERTAQLQVSEKKYRDLVENALVGVFIAYMEGRLLYANDALCNILGYEKTDELMNVEVSALYKNPKDKERLLEELQKSGKVINYEVEVVTRDGKSKNVILSALLSGDVLTGMVIDITEKKKLEMILFRTQRMESVGTLAGGIAHDLNNILAPIILALNILRKTFIDENSLKMLDVLESSAKRGAAIVKQILTFARGTEGERTPVQVRHLIEELKQFAQETFPAAIIIRANVQKNILPINADPTQLHQVLLNLAINARDAMPHGGTITIDAENLTLDKHYAAMNLDAKPGQYVLVSVSDSGTGIPLEIQEKIFEPFFTTKETGKGSGLGLATVFAIVKSHGGFLKLYSEVGRGSNFKLYFPAIVGEEMKEQQALHIESFEGHGECILLVDDEYIIREVSKLALESNGYNVMLAADGIEAVSLFAQHREKIDLVITDMNMPNMDGSTLIRTLQKMKPSLPIIGASGLADKAKLAEIGDLNIGSFLSKPYTAEILLKAISDLLHKKSDHVPTPDVE
jgi:PAS domain S-box-containing protein